MSPWLTYGTLAIAIALVLAIFIVAHLGHQSHEKRPGYIDTLDLTRFTDDRSPHVREALAKAARVRAQSPAPGRARSFLSAMSGLVEVETVRESIGIVLALRLRNEYAERRAVLTDIEAFDVGANLIRLSGFPPPSPAVAIVQPMPMKSVDEDWSEQELARRRAQQPRGPLEIVEMSEEEFARMHAQQALARNRGWKDKWPNRAEAERAGCTCTWATSSSIVEFSLACPILPAHRREQGFDQLGGDAA